MLYRSVIPDNRTSAVRRSVIVTVPLLIQPAAYTQPRYMSQSIVEQPKSHPLASTRNVCTTLTSRRCESDEEALNCQLTGFEAGPWATTGCEAGLWATTGCEAGHPAG